MASSYNDLRALLSVTLADAEEMSRHSSTAPTSEDIRALGITLFIEARRSQVVLPDRVRFVSKCYELLPVLGEINYRMVLEEFGVTSPADILDLEIMKSFTESLVEESVTSHPEKTSST